MTCCFGTNPVHFSALSDKQVSTADGTAEVDAAVQLVDDLDGTQRIALGADKGYDRHGFV